MSNHDNAHTYPAYLMKERLAGSCYRVSIVKEFLISLLTPKKIPYVLFVSIALLLSPIWIPSTIEQSAIDNKTTEFCTTLLASHPPTASSLHIYDRYRTDHYGNVVRPKGFAYFLALRSRILSQTGTFESMDIRKPDETEDVHTELVWIKGSKKLIDVIIDLVNDRDGWHVIDLHLPNEE